MTGPLPDRPSRTMPRPADAGRLDTRIPRVEVVVPQAGHLPAGEREDTGVLRVALLPAGRRPQPAVRGERDAVDELGGGKPADGPTVRRVVHRQAVAADRQQPAVRGEGHRPRSPLDLEGQPAGWV